MTAKTTRKTGGRSRRTKGAGGIIHRADGRWEFRREIGRDPATCLWSNKRVQRHHQI